MSARTLFRQLMTRTLRVRKTAPIRRPVGPVGRPIEVLEDVIKVADYVLLMSVNPGFGGQKLIPYVLDKVRRLIDMRRAKKLTFRIEIDGGVHRDNLAEVVRAGCDWIVTGSGIFHTPDPEATVREFREIAAQATAVRV